MSHNPRVTPSPAIITRTKREGIDITITDGNYTQTGHINRFGELNKAQDNTFAIKLKRNLNGQIIKKSETLQGKAKVGYTYRYDKQGRLIEVKRNNQSVERYSYDSNRNREHAYICGKHYKASYYTLDDQLIVYGNNSYRYDDDGYLVEKTTPEGTTAYSYNTMGALTDVNLPNGTQIHYITDPLNRRIAKEVNGTIVEKYLWEDLTTLLAIYDRNDNLVWRFEYADGRMPVSMTDKEGNRYYLHYDQVGSLRAVSDSSGNVVKEIVYDSYGNVLSDSAPSFKVPFGFAGGLYDSDTKLTHFGFREYDAFTGKWTSKDPIGFAGGDSNLYGYVLGDPVTGFDPSGLVDENYIKPDGYSNTILHYVGSTINYDDIYTILTHGYDGILLYVPTLETLAENAKKSGKKKIKLLACNQSGQGDAQDLADLSGLPVIYNEGTVHLVPFLGSVSFSPWKTVFPRKKK